MRLERFEVKPVPHDSFKLPILRSLGMIAGVLCIEVSTCASESIWSYKLCGLFDPELVADKHAAEWAVQQGHYSRAKDRILHFFSSLLECFDDFIKIWLKSKAKSVFFPSILWETFANFVIHK